MFPVTSPDEMAGQAGENPVADAAADGDLAGPNGVWQQLAMRVRSASDYLPYFRKAYPDEVTEAADITMVHVANAIGAFEDVAFRTVDSPFDRLLRGSRAPQLSRQPGGCAALLRLGWLCSMPQRPLQTDHRYHATGMPQIGPGKGDMALGGDSFADFGRERVTGDPADRYRFRTPSLRNVALTGPWGHDGAYATLRAMVRHKLDAAAALETYDPDQAVLPSREDLDAIDLVHHSNPANRADLEASIDPLLASVRLKGNAIDLLLEFLYALTDPASLDLRSTVPSKVPSGLPLGD